MFSGIPVCFVSKVPKLLTDPGLKITWEDRIQYGISIKNYFHGAWLSYEII